jgi:hypothetical protein
MTNNKKTLTAAFAALLLVGCGNEDSDSVSQEDVHLGVDLGVESQIIASVSAAETDECSVQATWTGDFEGSVDWVPDKAPGYSGFTIENRTFSVETGIFNLTADFETPIEMGSTGTFDGEATYFYVTDASYEGRMSVEETATIGFPMHHDQVARGVPVTLEISEWQDTRISGSVKAGPFTGVATGPQAPRDGGPDGPLKPITVSGSAHFLAARDFSGDTIDNLVGRRKCHQPYVR